MPEKQHAAGDCEMTKRKTPISNESLRERLLSELNSVNYSSKPPAVQRWIDRGRALAAQPERDGWPTGVRAEMFRRLLETCHYVAITQSAEGPHFPYLMGTRMLPPKGVKVHTLLDPQQGPQRASLC